jgi:putative nucleotidyltransferase with HDIG domain
MNISREDSIKLLDEYIENDNLKNHCYMVATAMEAYAKELNKSEDEIEEWWTAGLLHDLDWEKYPDEHPNKAINEILPEKGYEQKILDAIAAHGPDRTGKEPETEIERYLFACDELSGFMNAVSLMRPTKFEGMKVKSITKRLKQKNFAAGVNRDDVYKGVELINTDLNEHVQFLIGVFQKEN